MLENLLIVGANPNLLYKNKPLLMIVADETCILVPIQIVIVIWEA